MGSSISQGIGQNLAANITGRTDGLTPSAGKIGEEIIRSTKNSGNLTSNEYFDALSAPFTLAVGVYDVYTNISLLSTGSPSTIRVLNIGIGTASGNSSTGAPGGAYNGELITNVPSAYSAGIRVSCVHGLIVTNASQNYYLKGYYGATGTPGTATLDYAIARIVRRA